MVRRADTEEVTRGKTLYVSALALPLLEVSATKKIYPQPIVIAISDERILHALRDKKVKPLSVSS